MNAIMIAAVASATFSMLLGYVMGSKGPVWAFLLMWLGSAFSISMLGLLIRSLSQAVGQ